MRHFQRIASACVLLALAVLLRPAVAGAQEQVAMVDRGPRFMQPAPGGGAPQEVDVTQVSMLRRRVSLNREGATVAKLLGEITRQTGLRFSYDAEVVAVDRLVGLRADSITVAAALTEILVDAGVDVLLKSPRQAVLLRRREPLQNGAIAGQVTDAKTSAALAGATVVVDGTSRNATTDNNGRYRIDDIPAGTYTLRARYIGYAPGMASVTVKPDQEATADFALEKSVQRLDEVVTTGTVAETQVKALPSPITVITGEEIAERNIQHVDDLFRGEVPGVLAWNLGINNYFSNFGTIRGTSALLGQNALKVYIDGVEVTDETYLTNIDPGIIDRVEIVRGPQASTLYGSQALNGVMQIFTKKGRFGLTRPEIEGKASVGVVESPLADKTAATQDYGVQVSGGSEHASYHVGGSYGRVGAYMPQYGDVRGGAFGGARVVGGPLTAEFSARYGARSTDFAVNPFYPAAFQPAPSTNNGPQQTYATTVTYRATPSWEHVLVAGIDQKGFEQYYRQPRLSTPADTFFQVSSASADRKSIGYHTTLTAHPSDAISTTWTAGLEHWTFSQSGYFVTQTPRTTGSLPVPPGAFVSLSRTSFSNDGYFGQLQAGLHDAVFVTAGLRMERNSNAGIDVRTAWAPRLGLSAVKELGGVSAKVRASYGKAIRPPAFGLADAFVGAGFIQLANPDLKPEEQSGVDGGLELYFGRRASFQVTYYHQEAQNLIDQEQVSVDPTTGVTTFQNTNLGRVKNTGWELQATIAPLTPLTVSGTFSITRSRIDSLGPGYGGLYQVGDEVLGAPRRSGGASMTYTLPSTTLAAG
jgi:TonB-dependent starch-binding outer membrane protein SusC